MSTDLETRLRSLSELSPPSHAALGASELHRRASRRQQRTIALRAVPAVVVVVALLAGALALANRTATTDVLVGPDTTEAPDSAALSERDHQVIDVADSASEIATEIDREMLLSATFTATGGSTGEDGLLEQRGVTDRADAAFRARLDEIDPASISPEVDESVKQALNRLDRLETNRLSVDQFQTDPSTAIEMYANTTTALIDVTMRLGFAVRRADVMRGILAASYAGAAAAQTNLASATLTISIEVGFYGAWVSNAPPATIAKFDCGDDPEGAEDACPAYWQALGAEQERSRNEQMFFGFATGQQKQWYRAADAGSDYDTLVASAFEDGIGINDLTGTVPRSIPIDPTAWRAAALRRLDRFAAFQQQLFASIGEPEPTTASPGTGTIVGTAPTIVVEATTTTGP